MNIMIKVTMNDGISYLVNSVDDIIIHGNTTGFEDYVLGKRKVITTDIKRISVVQL